MFLQKRLESLKLHRFQDLCAMVPEQYLAQAVGDMCAALTDVMVMHYLMTQVRNLVCCLRRLCRVRWGPQCAREGGDRAVEATVEPTSGKGWRLSLHSSHETLVVRHYWFLQCEGCLATALR